MNLLQKMCFLISLMMLIQMSRRVSEQSVKTSFFIGVVLIGNGIRTQGSRFTYGFMSFNYLSFILGR